MTEKEFTEVVHSTKKVVLAAVQKHLPAQFFHAVDDAVQETYLRAFRALEKNKFRGESELSTWLYSIARNESLRLAGKLVREEQKTRKAQECAEKERGFGQVGAAALPEELLPEMGEIRGRITSMPKKYREVFQLLLEGLTERQIAQRLNISRGTIKSRTSRGKELLSRMMSGAAK